MSFEKLKTVAGQVLNRLPSVAGRGEQATKQALVLPVLDALGYDIWNPSEVCPEYEADFATKKAGQKEKVDVAVLLRGSPRVYIETKCLDDMLDGHEGQLARYFNSTQSVTLGVLTNGIEWRFFTDTGDPNVMDLEPFHVSRLDVADQGLDVMARFAKTVFSPESIRDYATELRYTARIAAFLRAELDLRDREPSEYFIRWILKSEKMYDGVVNAGVLERFRPITKDALTRVVREIVRRSISAMEKEAAASGVTAAAAPSKAAVAVAQAIDEADPGDSVVRSRAVPETTARELQSFAVVKAIFEASAVAGRTIYDASARAAVPVEIGYKDTTGYFGIYLNKPAWWVMRVSIEGRKNWVGFNLDPALGAPLIPTGCARMEPSPWAEFRVQINTPEDLNGLRDLIVATCERLIDGRQRSSE